VYNKVLGEGSFSKVYLGELKKSKKLVAIKQVDKLESNEIACLMNS
jgi:serine/threonine protein kinase